MSTDPARDDESNLYRYAGNDPVGESDPSGLQGIGENLRRRRQLEEDLAKPRAFDRRRPVPPPSQTKDSSEEPTGTLLLEALKKAFEKSSGKASDPKAMGEYLHGVFDGILDSLKDYVKLFQLAMDTALVSNKFNPVIKILEHTPIIGGPLKKQVKMSEDRLKKLANAFGVAVSQLPELALQMLTITLQIMKGIEKSYPVMGRAITSAMRSSFPVLQAAELAMPDLPAADLEKLVPVVEKLAAAVILEIADDLGPREIGFVVGVITWEVIEVVLIAALAAVTAGAAGLLLAAKFPKALRKILRLKALKNNKGIRILLETLSKGLKKGKIRSFDELIKELDEAVDAAIDAAKGARRRLRGQSVNPNSIRFSQSSVNDVAVIERSMRARGWVGDPIDVVRMGDGALTTADNTRVLAARRAGIDVQAVIHKADDLIPAGRAEDFIPRRGPNKGVPPKTWGEAIENRIRNQNSEFRKRHPQGSPRTGSKE